MFGLKDNNPSIQQPIKFVPCYILPLPVNVASEATSNPVDDPTPMTDCSSKDNFSDVDTGDIWVECESDEENAGNKNNNDIGKNNITNIVLADMDSCNNMPYEAVNLDTSANVDENNDIAEEDESECPNSPRASSNSDDKRDDESVMRLDRLNDVLPIGELTMQELTKKSKKTLAEFATSVLKIKVTNCKKAEIIDAIMLNSKK